MPASSFPVKVLNILGTEGPLPTTIRLSTLDGGVSHIILDYGRAVGGITFFETAHVHSEEGTALLDITYSETRAGIEKEKGIYSYPPTCLCLTSSRRWTIPIIFQYHGHVSSEYSYIFFFARQAICRIKIRTEITKIPKTCPQIIKLLSHILIHRIPTPKTSSRSNKHFQMFKRASEQNLGSWS